MTKNSFQLSAISIQPRSVECGISQNPKSKIQNPKLVIPHSEKGMALILTLVILVLLTAMITEFAYGVYTTTVATYNWRDSQRLSLAAKSGMTLAVKTVSDMQGLYSYTYPDRLEMPVENILSSFNGTVLIRVEDENSRFNLNSLVYPNGTLNTNSYKALRNLLKTLNLSEDLADLIADWIDKDSESRLRDSENNAKNGYMDSVDELLLIKGMERQVYEKLLPYVTVYGIDSLNDDRVNINTAAIPVIMSVDEHITKELADRIVAERTREPLRKTSDIMKVAGFEGQLGQALMGRISVKSSTFRITAYAEENKIKRIMESVLEIRSGQATTRYWKEI